MKDGFSVWQPLTWCGPLGSVRLTSSSCASLCLGMWGTWEFSFLWSCVRISVARQKNAEIRCEYQWPYGSGLIGCGSRGFACHDAEVTVSWKSYFTTRLSCFPVPNLPGRACFYHQELNLVMSVLTVICKRDWHAGFVHRKGVSNLN